MKKYTRVLSVLYLLAILLSLETTAYALKSYDPLQVEIPYKHVYTTTDKTVDSIFHYIITSTNGAPLPVEASETGSFSFDGVSGKGVMDGAMTTFDLSGTLTFTFSKPGVYEYELKADRETDSKKTNSDRYTFEVAVTTITFYVIDSPDNEIELQAFTVENDRDIKINKMKLAPAYRAPINSEADHSVSGGSVTNSFVSGNSVSAGEMKHPDASASWKLCRELFCSNPNRFGYQPGSKYSEQH